MRKTYETLEDVLRKQERGERIGKKKVVIVSNTTVATKVKPKVPKNIFYLQALNIAFNHLDYDTAKSFVNTMSKEELKNFVNDWLN